MQIADDIPSLAWRQDGCEPKVNRQSLIISGPFRARNLGWAAAADLSKIIVALDQGGSLAVADCHDPA